MCRLFARTSCENMERLGRPCVHDCRTYWMSFIVQSMSPSHETHKADFVLLIRRMGGALFFQQSSQPLAVLTCCWMVGNATSIDVDAERCALASLLNPALYKISCHIVKLLATRLQSDDTHRRHRREGTSRKPQHTSSTSSSMVGLVWSVCFGRSGLV